MKIQEKMDTNVKASNKNPDSDTQLTEESSQDGDYVKLVPKKEASNKVEDNDEKKLEEEKLRNQEVMEDLAKPNIDAFVPLMTDDAAFKLKLERMSGTEMLLKVIQDQACLSLLCSGSCC